MKWSVTESDSFVHAVIIHVLFTACVTLGKGSTSSNALVQLNNCVCLGHEVTYECTVCGEGATVWTGSLFDCSSGEIILLHRQFTLPYSEICNNKIVNFTDNTTTTNGMECFISQLRFVINDDDINKTITCLHDHDVNNTPTPIHVGEISVTVTKEPFPPLSDVRVTNIGPAGLTLSWNNLSIGNCAVFMYHVSSTGDHEDCLNNSVYTHASPITIPSIIPDGKQCNFIVQAQVCGMVNDDKHKSDPLSVTFKVPKPPVFTHDYYYSLKNKLLHVAFTESESFNLSIGVDGSALFYTVTYFDTMSAIVCGSTHVSAKSCKNGVCRSQFYLPDSACSNSVIVTVTVYATNVLGNGSVSMPVYISVAGDTQSGKIVIAVSILVLFIFVTGIGGIIAAILNIRKKRQAKHPELSITSSRIPQEGPLYVDVGPFTKSLDNNRLPDQFLDDERVEYAKIRHTDVTKIDKLEQDTGGDLNLDILLLQICSQVTPVWYEFGQAVGVNQEILDKCLGYPADECIVEVLDHWLRMHNPTWKDVSKGLSEVGLQSLSEGILDVYKTGKLPIEVEMNAFSHQDNMSQNLHLSDSEELPPPLPPKKTVS